MNVVLYQTYTKVLTNFVFLSLHCSKVIFDETLLFRTCDPQLKISFGLAIFRNFKDTKEIMYLRTSLPASTAHDV